MVVSYQTVLAAHKLWLSQSQSLPSQLQSQQQQQQQPPALFGAAWTRVVLDEAHVTRAGGAVADAVAALRVRAARSKAAGAGASANQQTKSVAISVVDNIVAATVAAAYNNARGHPTALIAARGHSTSAFTGQPVPQPPRLPLRPGGRWAVTATPYNNGLADMYFLLDFLRVPVLTVGGGGLAMGQLYCKRERQQQRQLENERERAQASSSAKAGWLKHEQTSENDRVAFKGGYASTASKAMSAPKAKASDKIALAWHLLTSSPIPDRGLSQLAQEHDWESVTEHNYFATLAKNTQISAQGADASAISGGLTTPLVVDVPELRSVLTRLAECADWAAAVAPAWRRAERLQLQQQRQLQQRSESAKNATVVADNSSGSSAAANANDGVSSIDALTASLNALSLKKDEQPPQSSNSNTDGTDVKATNPIPALRAVPAAAVATAVTDLVTASPTLPHSEVDRLLSNHRQATAAQLRPLPPTQRAAARAATVLGEFFGPLLLRRTKEKDLQRPPARLVTVSVRGSRAERALMRVVEQT